MLELKPHILSFVDAIRTEKVEIYNEFSLEHELGIHLRQVQDSGWKVQFERNVSFFNPERSGLPKKEIDISIFNPSKSERYAVELKYPHNGQHPEQMFKACQDISFLEQLVTLCDFQAGYFLIVVDDPLFYSGEKINGIYSYFRAGKSLTGQIPKPTGKKDETAEIHGKYQIDWQPIKGKSKFAWVEITKLADGIR